MKNVILFSLLFLLSFSCEKPTELHTNQAESIASNVAAYNKGKLEHEHAKWFEGDFHFYNAGQEALIVNISGEENSSVVLQTNDLPASFIKAPNNARRAVGLDDEFWVLGKNDEVLLVFALKSKSSLTLLQEPDLSTLHTGYGLIYTDQLEMANIPGVNTKVRGYFIPLGNIVNDALGCACNPVGTSDRGCSSGGVGSTSCSSSSSGFGGNSSCSVTCGDGYYSCCTD